MLGLALGFAVDSPQAVKMANDGLKHVLEAKGNITDSYNLGMSALPSSFRPLVPGQGPGLDLHGEERHPGRIGYEKVLFMRVWAG